MCYVGIDLHKKRSRYVVLDQAGRVFKKETIASTPEEFKREFSSLDPSTAVVALEATINWYWAVDALQELGLEVHLADPRKVRLIAESTIKTDTVDATALANLARMRWLPESRITPREVRLVRERLRYRITLVRLATSVKCRVHALVGKAGIETPAVSDVFGKAGREWLDRLELAAEYRANLDGYLRMLDHLRAEIGEVERWLKARTREERDMQLLMGIPGIGRFGAALVLAEIGDIGFFRTKRKLSSFVGVVPGARNSGEKRRDGSLKKDSNRYVRWLLAEAATKAMRVVPAWRRLYERVYGGNAKRKGKARMAVMHKLVCAIWRVLVTKEEFDRLHNCPELTATKASSPLGSGVR
jgi:transposase